MTFSEALEAAKNGAKIAREGWNGKNMWVAFTPGSEVAAADARSGAVRARAEEGAETITIHGHLDMKTADGSIIIGWHATQTDMFATDWSEVA